MPKILSDEQAACNIIRKMRKLSKRQKSKTISVPLEIDDFKLSLKTMVAHTPNKCDVIRGSGIGYKTICICPTTNQKLKCTNQHALDMLYKSRKSNLERYKQNRKCD